VSAPRLDHSVVDAVLATAATVLDMEVVFLGGLTDESFTFAKVHARADWPEIQEGVSRPRTDSFCHRLLAGAEPVTSDAAHSSDYADTPAREAFGITSYVGVPVHGPNGTAVATLCGIDRRGVAVPEDAIEVLRGLATILSIRLGPLAAERIVISRAPEGGWEVEGDHADDLTSAMVLADLLAGEISPIGRPAKSEAPLDEVSQLKLSVKQLEHALAARVVVEQAIGVLTERQGSSPRDAFERLRKVARSRGRKVHDLAREVVASASDHSVPLPPELAGRR
jgi:hypothetical protein